MDTNLESLIAKIKKDGIEESNKISKDIIEKTNSQAKAIIKEAEDKAKKIEEQAKNSAAKLKSDSQDSLKQQTNQIWEQNIKHLQYSTEAFERISSLSCKKIAHYLV